MYSRLPLRITSWFVLLFAFIIAISWSTAANALTITGSGQKTISAVVEGPPPSSPPTIDAPSNGLNFDNKNITVSGSCITNLVVKVFSNNVFVGSAVCQSGTYSLQIDLFVDRNDLIARQYDFLNQPSPDSNAVTVYYLLPSSQASLNSSTSPSSSVQANFSLYINYDYTVLGVFPNQAYRLPITFGGGTPPYAVSVDWGDGSNSLYSRGNNEKFFAEHVYKIPGLYTVKVKVIDRFGEESYLQFVVVVNGPTKPFINQVFGNGFPINGWQAGGLFFVAIIGFLGGQHYQQRKHKKMQ